MTNHKLQAELMGCETLKQMIELMFNKYDINFKPNFLQKTIFVTGLMSVANMLKGREKVEVVETKQNTTNDKKGK